MTRLGMLLLTVSSCLACTPQFRFETTKYDAVVVEPAKVHRDSRSGLRCWAVVRLRDNRLQAVQEPTDRCLTLLKPDQPLQVVHHRTWHGSEIWKEYWRIQ